VYVIEVLYHWAILPFQGQEFYLFYFISVCFVSFRFFI
jgi:hypothetical protein